MPPETASVSSLGKKTVGEEPTKKKNPGAVKISPWTLARLNAEEVSRVAAEARKKSKILKPVVRQGVPSLETGPSFGTNMSQIGLRPRQAEPLATSFGPLQFEARSAFQTSKAMSSSTCVIGSSPESSIDSPDIRPFRAVALEDPIGLTDFSSSRPLGLFPRNSTSDGYEASGGEDSDRVPSRFVQRSTNLNGPSSSSGRAAGRNYRW